MMFPNIFRCHKLDTFDYVGALTIVGAMKVDAGFAMFLFIGMLIGLKKGRRWRFFTFGVWLATW